VLTRPAGSRRRFVVTLAVMGWLCVMAAEALVDVTVRMRADRFCRADTVT
jgi:hypothetical protein